MARRSLIAKSVIQATAAAAGEEVTAVPDRQAGLTALNELLLRACCAPAAWARRLAAGRPYESAADLFAAADEALAAMTENELDEAMAGHPRIGDRPTGSHAADSAREQSAALSAQPDVLAALAEGNQRYEERFGHVYLVCADGRSGEELLAVLRQRLRNDPGTERAQARAELGKINKIRLGRLIARDTGATG
jgi:2-oxo-4-hydroxy-4-carboxy-5-ureidoimidazoline decarboxylase